MKNIKMTDDREIIRNMESGEYGDFNNNLNRAGRKENKIESKTSSSKAGKTKKLVNQVRLCLEMLKDYRTGNYKKIPWRTIGIVAAALLYFLNPFDVIPDFLPVIGFTDDAITFAAVFRSFQGDLSDYCEWKNYDKELYF